MAGNRAASLIGGTNSGKANNSNAPYPSTMSPPMWSPPPLPQVPPPPESSLDIERIRWKAGSGHQHNFNDPLKQNVYAVSISSRLLFP